MSRQVHVLPSFPKSPTSPKPVNHAPWRQCQWYGDGLVTVHLWAPYEDAINSFDGSIWSVRSCRVCGDPDIPIWKAAT